VPTTTRHDSGVAQSFTVEVDGTAVPGVTGVSGLAVEREAIEFREGGADGSVAVRRLPGRWKAGEVTLTRRLTTDLTFESWIRDPGPDGQEVATRDVRIRVFDRQGTPVRRYRLIGAWPRRLEVSGSTTAGTAGILEVVVLSYDASLPE
jgi:phage tail-like protein